MQADVGVTPQWRFFVGNGYAGSLAVFRQLQTFLQFARTAGGGDEQRNIAFGQDRSRHALGVAVGKDHDRYIQPEQPVMGFGRQGRRAAADTVNNHAPSLRDRLRPARDILVNQRGARARQGFDDRIEDTIIIGFLGHRAATGRGL